MPLERTGWLKTTCGDVKVTFRLCCLGQLLVVTKSDVAYIMITWHNLNASYLQFHFLTDQYLYCHAMTLPDTKRHEIDTPTKNRIIGRALETGNAAQARRDENVNPRTAQRIVKRYQKIGSTSNKPHPGRPQKLNHYDKHQIL